jgi:hypothetical protein
MLDNQKGVALAYVLIAFVFVGAIASLMLNMANKESADSALRASSEMARFAANAGLTYTTNFFTDTTTAAQTKALDILKHWYANWKAGGDLKKINDNYSWIAGDKDSYLDTNGMKFRVRIVNIDFDSIQQVSDVSTTPPKMINEPNTSPIKILLKSEAIDKSGSRASSFGTYRIIGFEDREVPRQEITHALYLGGGSILINATVDINGDVYIGGQNSTLPPIQHTNQSTGSTQISHYRGEFRHYGNPAGQASLLANERFHGPAYFEGGEINFSHYGTTDNIFYDGFGASNVTIKNKTSRATMANGTASKKNLAIFAGDVKYSEVNPSPWGYQLVFGTNCSLRYVPSSNFVANFYSGSPAISNTAPITRDTVLKALGMSIDEPPSFEIILSNEILAKRHNLPAGGAGTITGTTLNGYLTNNGIPKYTDNDGNQWLVLATSNAAVFGGGGSAFNGNAIIINRHGGNAAGSLFNVGAGGVVLFFVPPDDHPDPNLRPVDKTVSYGSITGTFNGLFYNGSKSTRLTLGANNAGWTVNGAFYNIGNGGDPSNNAEIWIGASGANGIISINFNNPTGQNALNKIQGLGILSFSGGGSGDFDFSRVPKTILPKPISEMLSRSF